MSQPMGSAPRTVDSVLEHIFASPNPSTGSPPPPHVAWVVFEHGTVFFTYPSAALPVDATPAALIGAASDALAELGAVHVGTPSADFSASHLSDWFPGEGVYFIWYGHKLVASVVLGGASDLTAGMAGRSRRQADFEARKVAVVRSFDGQKTSAPTAGD